MLNILFKMPARRRVSLRQMELLVEFAESNPDVALGRFSGGPQAVRVTRDVWNTLAVQLNSVAEGTTKTPDQWRRTPSVEEIEAPVDAGIAPTNPVSYPSTSTPISQPSPTQIL
ncbi:hypothetical protein PYW07_006393 [Mythimna separata]|uniref:Regulatory protein zeste n=1 Tax=Mythimna separata TaxID=271217 RepID=A0AAD7YTI3_MYTSE|nr:hypothetical protein PYW07_006393 [Mythimna separata]